MYDFDSSDRLFLYHDANRTQGLVTTIGPWGAHTPPYSGDPDGGSKSNWIGLYAVTLDDLQIDGGGACSQAEFDAGNCGVPENTLMDRVPYYVVPESEPAFHITKVTLSRHGVEPEYFGSDQDWLVEGTGCDGRVYSIGHLGGLSEDLRVALMAAGYTDPDTVTEPGVNLVTGEPVVLNPGVPLAWPQIIGIENTNSSENLYTGAWSVTPSPHAQIEFHTRTSVQNEPIFLWLPEDEAADLERWMLEDIHNPDSFQYQSSWPAWDWLLGAEMALYTATHSAFSEVNYDSFIAPLGGWWEMPTGQECGSTEGVVDPMCDELFSIFPLQLEAVSPGVDNQFDSGLYENDVHYLVFWRRAGKPDWWGEVVEPLQPDPESGTLLIRWSVLHDGWYEDYSGASLDPNGDHYWQGLGYRLDSDAQVLRINWENRVRYTQRQNVVMPAIPDNNWACDGDSLTCHDRRYNGGNVEPGLPQ